MYYYVRYRLSNGKPSTARTKHFIQVSYDDSESVALDSARHADINDMDPTPSLLPHAYEMRGVERRRQVVETTCFRSSRGEKDC